jgi:oligopeptide/dipeptide ABC transporter ATP-binding protein
LIELRNVTKTFGKAGGLFNSDSQVLAVDDVSLTLPRGQSLGLVGESGSGKSTLGRLILRFERPTTGTVLFENRDIEQLDKGDLKRYRRRVQMVFQNPFSSLNPRRTIRDTLTDGYAVHGIARGAERERLLVDLLAHVGLNATMLDRYPHEFSGGQRQRIVIARALSVSPELIVADEPVSALDVSIQAQILNLMKSLQREYSLTFLMITHDLRVVRFFCERVAVMYLGRLVEIASRNDIVTAPMHPYTRMLISAAPSSETTVHSNASMVRGDIQATPQQRQGCVFSNRCWLKQALGNPTRCDTERPALREVQNERWAACHFAEEGLLTAGSASPAASVS